MRHALCIAAIAAGCANAAKPSLLQPVGRTHRGADAPVAAAAAGSVAPAARAPLAQPTRAVARPSDGTASAGSGAPAQVSPLDGSPMHCDLPDTPVEAPLFVTNGVTLRARGTQILDDVIACMRAGLLDGHDLLVVGHADPRGLPLYNETLALERARSVRRYLIRRGVAPERITVASRGARAARGASPESWMYDRRVEILLLPEPSAER